MILSVAMILIDRLQDEEGSKINVWDSGKKTGECDWPREIKMATSGTMLLFE